MYETSYDANLYLSGCYVKYKGDVVLVHEVSGGAALISSKGGSQTIPYNDLDLSPLSLGYKVYNGQAIYLSRSPTRQWRQGLTASTLQIKGDRVSCRSVLREPFLQKLSKDDYPKIEEAAEVARGSGNTTPFHKKYAIDKHGLLLYKDKMIGSYDGKQYQLLTPFTFLGNELKEVLNESK